MTPIDTNDINNNNDDNNNKDDNTDGFDHHKL